MKIYITTNIKPDLSELSEFFIEPIVNTFSKRLKTKFNPYFNEIWGDFNHIRFLSPKTGFDARCFITSRTHLINSGIDTHLGMYDMVDRDGVLDFYMGVNEIKKIDNRAKKNGFKTEEAWLIVHELCHGLLQKQNKHDSVHEMEKQGKLKDLYFELLNQQLKTKISLWQRLINLLFIKKRLTDQLMFKKKTLYTAALDNVGLDASPSDLVPDELGCAESVSNIIKQIIPTFPIVTGTWTLYDVLEHHPRFKRVTVPMPGNIILCPTIPGKPFPGHVGIVTAGNGIMSNDSKTGKFLKNYTLDSWTARWVKKGKYSLYFYQLIN